MNSNSLVTIVVKRSSHFQLLLSYPVLTNIAETVLFASNTSLLCLRRKVGRHRFL